MAEFSERQHPPHGPGPRSSTPQPDALAEDLYRRAVLAFKQGQDHDALNQFQQLIQLPTVTPSMQIKGQMGLILAQKRLGQFDQARQGCQQVLASGLPQARQWAESVLAKLPPLPQATSDATAPKFTTADATGFVPLDSPAINPPATAQAATALPFDPTGFTPLAPPVPATAVPGKTQHEGKTRSPLPPVAPGLGPDLGGPDLGGMDAPLVQGSLFHYQGLNQAMGAASPDPAPAHPELPDMTAMGAAISDPPVAPIPTGSQPLPRGQTALPRSSQRQGQRYSPISPPYQVWAAQMITVVVVLWVSTTGLHLLLGVINTVLNPVTWPISLGGLPLLTRSYTRPMVVLVLGSMLISPWWMDYLLAQIYGQRPLTTRQLQGTHPEILKRLRQQCQQMGWYLPELRLLPTADPLCFSYGWRPRHLRIVVSQGLLDSGDDELLGMFYAYELAHMVNQTTAVLSGLGGWLVIFHVLSGRLAQWSEGASRRFPKVALGGMACLCYGLFWSLRRGLLWLSRRRSDWADHRVEALTQRPDLQQQRLRWLTLQLPAHLAQRSHLHPLWESLDILMPLSPQSALSPGSLIPTLGESATVLNDWINPYRHWLVGGASHPPLGERLHWLNQRAIQRQQPTLDLTEPTLPILPTVSLPRLMCQKSPVLGLILGSGIALIFWFVGGLVLRLNWYRLSWWYQDESLLYGGILLGLGLGLLTRINTLYPDIPTTQAPVSDAKWLLGKPDQLPVEGEPCRLSGTLINPLGTNQDKGFFSHTLYLKTFDGLVKLGFSSPQPMLWALRPTPSPLKPWIGRAVTVSGWRRRNDGVVWVDVATIGLSSQRQAIPIVAPIWATLVSLGLCLAGVFVILAGV
ncbi:M48 family metalloprotease [Phormidium sp. FACHB-1136]|uniref:M48 family metalloprotease n=1 Tax=Phormidium sp. FACHB-1136 TaxID=2692848 RepID=UPI00168465E5|nr:M48 family metalloprotease [Phormidium sp. FACHB-1136]MBD2427159.1 hypothetical protein [Phormidium sp. FACHB-1136]